MIPKFRVWYGAEMYDEPVIHNGDFYLDWRDFIDGDTYDGAVLMQSTGLFDKDGTEIFEGDVVTFEDCDDVDTDFVYVNRGVIEYAAPTFHITNRNSTEMEDLLDGNTLDVIVLGSIYEKPELVEEQDEMD